MTSFWPAAAVGSLIRSSCEAVMGVTGSCQAFGPPTLPMCPTLEKRQTAFCH